MLKDINQLSQRVARRKYVVVVVIVIILFGLYIFVKNIALSRDQNKDHFYGQIDSIKQSIAIYRHLYKVGDRGDQFNMFCDVAADSIYSTKRELGLLQELQSHDPNLAEYQRRLEYLLTVQVKDYRELYEGDCEGMTVNWILPFIEQQHK